ncbi:TadE family type IV pilus minor pilin [Streptacidiphilus carbonis]|uniref:TadE family type IV pilus minor pilin n=1 Tax=Streptacidiphilus carbonis TaxID=105422 RepID=UPI0005A774A7|nr:TadE family type IV pilus minor pilin [Streptacidiphilus carbonis]
MRSERGAADGAGPEVGTGGGDGGFVTAETAVALPVLVLLTGVLVWGVLVGAAQLRCVDAAREAARAAARGDPQGRVLDVARNAGPLGASVSVSEGGDTVSVRVSATARAPGGLGGLLAVDVAATASAVREPGAANGGAR